MAMDARSIIGFGRKFHSKFSHFNRWNFKTRFLDTVGKNQGSSPKLPREGLLQRESAGGREEVERRRKVVLFYLICVTLSRYSRFTVSTDSPDHYRVTLIAHSSPTNRQGKLVKNSSQDTSRTSSKKKEKTAPRSILKIFQRDAKQRDTRKKEERRNIPREKRSSSAALSPPTPASPFPRNHYISASS